MGSHHIKGRTLILCVCSLEYISVLYTISAPLPPPTKKGKREKEKRKEKKGEKEGKKEKVKQKEGKRKSRRERKNKGRKERERLSGWHVACIFLRL